MRVKGGEADKVPLEIGPPDFHGQDGFPMAAEGFW
jgi:hypothetical protein